MSSQFKQDFPSLDKELEHYSRRSLNFPIEALNKCCLDKVKIKEAIEKHRDDCRCTNADYKCSWCNLIEQLSLDGDKFKEEKA